MIVSGRTLTNTFIFWWNINLSVDSKDKLHYAQLINRLDDSHWTNVKYSNSHMFPALCLFDCCGRYYLVFHMIYTQNNAINFLIKSCVANSIFQCFFFSFRQNVNNVKIVQLSTRQSNTVFFFFKISQWQNSKKKISFCSRIATFWILSHHFHTAFAKEMLGDTIG